MAKRKPDPRYPPGITQPGLRLWTRAARWPWFELVMCGLLGHAVVGRDVAEVRPEDALVLREIDGVRWHRCLRCDTWMALPAPDVPLREHLPPREEIELPDRGKPLRDRTIVRLIAVGRAIGFLVLSVLGVLFLLGSSSRAAAESSLSKALTNAAGGAAGSVSPQLQEEIDKYFSLSAQDLKRLGATFLIFGLLQGVEAIGLWRMKRWAYYFSFAVTLIQIPVEVLQAVHGASGLKIGNAFVDAGICIYLLIFKRLFGIRGGKEREREIRYAAVGWPALETATPPVARARASSG